MKALNQEYKTSEKNEFYEQHGELIGALLAASMKSSVPIPLPAFMDCVDLLDFVALFEPEDTKAFSKDPVVCDFQKRQALLAKIDKKTWALYTQEKEVAWSYLIEQKFGAFDHDCNQVEAPNHNDDPDETIALYLSRLPEEIQKQYIQEDPETDSTKVNVANARELEQLLILSELYEDGSLKTEHQKATEKMKKRYLSLTFL